MPKPRGREHTSLTDTAAEVVRVLERQPSVKMIAPGIIKPTSRRSSGGRFVTAVFTTAGLELIISGQSVQKVAVHADDPQAIFAALQNEKRLKHFVFQARERKPGV